MLFPRVVPSSQAETAFAAVYNVAGATVSAGGVVVWDTATADGIRVTKPATAVLGLVVGVAPVAIPDSTVGIVQVYGYNSATYVTNHTATTVAAGDILVAVDGQWHLGRSSTSTGISGFFHAGQTFAIATTPAAATGKVFIRAL